MDYDMKYVGELRFDEEHENPSVLLTRGQNGASIGICNYTATEFSSFGVHKDQEGFFVIEGRGRVYLDGKTAQVCAGCTFLLPPGVSHAFVRDPDSTPLKVLWFHAAP